MIRLPSPHRHAADLRAYAWTNRLAGFGCGLIVSTLIWSCALWIVRK